MKKIDKIKLLSLLFLVILVGCSEFLEENPTTQYNFEEYNNTNIESYVIGAYEPLTRSRGRLWESNLMIALTLLEESSNGQINSQPLVNFANYKFSQAEPNTYRGYEDAWTTFYESIGRANAILKGLEGQNSVSEKPRKEFIGELTFIRAICYYNLVRCFGSIPLRLNPPIFPDPGQPLEPIDNVYKQIINDLKIAEANLPAKNPKVGRATAGAAKVALADVYLTIKEYSLASAKANEVITNAGTYGYSLVSKFSDIFSPTTFTNTEDVFSIKFSKAIGFGNFITATLAPNGFTELVGTATVNRTNRDAGISSPNGLSRVGADIASPLIANWNNSDLRKSWTIYDKIVIGTRTLTPTNFPTKCEFFYGKYRDPDQIEETAAGNDFYLYRYADALLIFAEAENMAKSAPTPEAYNALNSIRRRAYGVPLNAPSALADAPAGLSVQAFDDFIFQERGYEFMEEGKRWFDLVRTGRWKTFIPAAGKTLPADNVTNWPIPNVELQNNPALK